MTSQPNLNSIVAALQNTPRDSRLDLDAERFNMAAMTPRGELASSGYCLVNPGKEYLVFVPGGGDVTVDLTTVSGTLAVEWLRLAEEVVTQEAPVPGGAKRRLRAPFAGDAAIHLKTEPPQMERKTK